jgi:exonuclease I
MQPKPQERDAFELFQAHFDQQLNPRHELVQLARKLALSPEGIDWARFGQGLKAVQSVAKTLA